MQRFRTFTAFDRPLGLYRRKFGRTDYVWDGQHWFHAVSGRPAPPKRNADFCRRTLRSLDEAGFCAEETVSAARESLWAEGLEDMLLSIETVARTVLEDDPDDPVALRVLCAGLRACEQPMRALHETAGRGRQDPRLLVSRSAALLDLGQFGGARREIERALELGPDPEALSLRDRIRRAA